MKTTQTTVYRSLQNQIFKTQNSLIELRMAAASGRRINKPSDDPSAIRPVLNARGQIQKCDRYLRTMGSASDRLNILDANLAQVGNLMIRAQETTIAAGNGSAGPEDLRNYAAAIGHIRDELFALANANVDGKYLFSGFAEDTPPFDISNDPPWTYQGDEGLIQLEIGPGERVQVNLTGNTLFLGEGLSGGLNVFEVLDAIETALAAGDSRGALDRLDDLQQATEQIGRQRSLMGNVGARVVNAQDHMERTRIDMHEILSRYEDVDIVEIITALMQQEQAFEAALNVTAKVSNLSILNYL